MKCKKIIKTGSIFITSMCVFLNFFILLGSNNSLSVSAVQTSASQILNSGDLYYIKNVRSGKYLDVYNGNTTDGTNIIQYSFTGNPNQQWKITYNSKGQFGGMFNITSAKNSNRALAVQNTSGKNGVNVILRTKASVVNQYFRIERLNNTSFKNFNKCK